MSVGEELEELEAPDDDNEHYSWDNEFQKHIISLLLVDKQFLLQSINLIRPSYFTNKVHQVACKFLFEFFNKYKLVPKKAFIIQQIKETMKDDKALMYYLGEINALYDYFEAGMEAREYLSDKITFFAKIQSLKTAFHKCLGMIDKSPEDDKTWGEVYEILRKAMNTDRNFEFGLKYMETYEERYKRMMAEDDAAEIFLLGLPGIDTQIKGGGYKRGEIVSIVAASGVGKSVMLSCMAATNALRGKKVVYITLELSEDRVAERFDSILTGCSIHTLYEEKDEVFTRLRDVLEDHPEKNPIVIKYFPSKSADVNTIRAYLAQLKFEGYIPDMVIVDYLGILKDYAGMEIHRSREQLVEELRALANEGDKFFCASAMQPNRNSKEAQKAGRIEAEHIGASWDQINGLDGAISLNQNEIEKKLQIGRAGVMKQRFGASNYQIYLHFDPNTLKITEISHDTYKNLMSKNSDKASKKVDVDLVVRPFTPDDEENGDSSTEDKH